MKITDKELIYQQYLDQENNKNVVRKFYDNLNNELWGEIIKLFHDNYFLSVDGFIDNELGELKNSNRKFVETFFEENHKKLSELGKSKNMKYVWPPTNTKELVDIMKLEAEFEKVSVKIFNIYADGNIVFVTRSYKLTEAVSKVTTNRIVHDRFLMEDGKIRQTESYHNHLSTLIEAGRVVFQQNDVIKVQNYLDNLKKLGIIQE